MGSRSINPRKHLSCVYPARCLVDVPVREILLSWKMYFKNGRLCYDSRVVVAAVAQCSRHMDNKKICNDQITTVLSDLKLFVVFGITVHYGLRPQHMRGYKEVIDVICSHRPSLEVTID